MLVALERQLQLRGYTTVSASAVADNSVLSTQGEQPALEEVGRISARVNKYHEELIETTLRKLDNIEFEFELS